MTGAAVVTPRWMARGEREIPSTETWLTAAEVTYAAGVRFSKRRSEYLLRRWVCKQAVVAAADMPSDLASLARVEVANHPGGAPFLLVDGSPFPLEISLSDRAGWAVCVVAGQHARVGCDLEIVEPRSAGFVADFLTPMEQDYVASRPDDDRHSAANLIWSAKESALKVLQTGLRRDTRSVEVVIDPPLRDVEPALVAGWARLVVRTAEGGLIPGWWRRDGAFLVTVASERSLLPPAPMVGSADLIFAEPSHSWVSRPVAPDS